MGSILAVIGSAGDSAVFVNLMHGLNAASGVPGASRTMRIGGNSDDERYGLRECACQQKGCAALALVRGHAVLFLLTVSCFFSFCVFMFVLVHWMLLTLTPSWWNPDNKPKPAGIGPCIVAVVGWSSPCATQPPPLPFPRNVCERNVV